MKDLTLRCPGQFDLFIIVAFVMISFIGTPSRAQSLCSVVPPPTLCLNQPQSGDTSISGQADKGTVDIKVEGFQVIVHRKVKVRNHKFVWRNIDALRADLIVSATYDGKDFSELGQRVLGHGQCEENSGTVCLEMPVIGESNVTVRAAKDANDAIADYQVIVFSKPDSHERPIPVGEVKADGTSSVPLPRKLTSYDAVGLANDQGDLVAGPLIPQKAKPPAACSAKSAKLPCLKPVKSTDKSVTGFAVPGEESEVEIAVNKVDKGKPPVDSKTGAFTLELSSLAKGQTITATQTAPLPVAEAKTITTTVADAPAKVPTECSQKSANLPCLKPMKSTDKSVIGFAVPGSEVDIDVDEVDKGKPPVDSKTGAFTLKLSSLTEGQTITATQTTPPPVGTTTVADAPAPESTSALYTMGLAGVNVAGSSNSGPAQQYFVSFDTRLPMPFLGHGPCASPEEGYVMDYKCWVWFNPRIASAPTPSSSALKSFSSVSALTSGISGETLGQITQTVEFHSGMEYRLFPGPPVPTSTTVAFRGVLSLILGGGIVTPINSISSASIFTLNNNLGNQFTENSLNTTAPNKAFASTYPILASALCGHFGFASTPPCTPSAVTYGNVAFVLPNRSRFYRDFFAGIRLRTFFFSGDCSHKSNAERDEAATSCKAANIYPGTFDIHFGQDETVTGGFLKGVVMTSTASYPLPGTSGAVRIFGSAYLSMSRNKNTTALALVAASSTIPITDPSVVIQPIQPDNHDYYRLGIGVDLIPLITKWTSSKTSSDSSNTSTSSQ